MERAGSGHHDRPEQSRRSRKGYGFRDVEKKLPVTSNTLFAIGSTTKAFTTFLIGTLVDEGKLGWDKPVREFLPEFRLSDPRTTELITPRDLLTHRSGLPRHDLVWYNNTTSTRKDIVQRSRTSKLPKRCAPNSSTTTSCISRPDISWNTSLANPGRRTCASGFSGRST